MSQSRRLVKRKTTCRYELINVNMTPFQARLAGLLSPLLDAQARMSMERQVRSESVDSVIVQKHQIKGE